MLLATFNNIYSITDFKVACFTLDKIVCTQRNFLTANCHKFQVRAVNRSHIVIIIGKLCKTVFRFFLLCSNLNKRVLVTEYYSLTNILFCSKFSLPSYKSIETLPNFY